MFNSSIETVHDAYMIAVKDNVRKKFDQFIAGKEIYAVDMTKPFAATTCRHNSNGNESYTVKPSQEESQIQSYTVKTSHEDNTLHLQIQQDPVHLRVSNSVIEAESVSLPDEKKAKICQRPTSHWDFNTIGDSSENSSEWLQLDEMEDTQTVKQGTIKRKVFQDLEKLHQDWEELTLYNICTQQRPFQRFHQPIAQDLERLPLHEAGLKERKEEESRLQEEQELFISSLRSSKRLHALENIRPVSYIATGHVNTAFDAGLEFDFDDGGDCKRKVQDLIHETYLKQHIVTKGVEDLVSSLHHIQNQLNDPEDENCILFLRSLVQNKQFQQAVNLHKQLIELTSRSSVKKSVTDDADKLWSEIEQCVMRCRHSTEALELLSLLNKSQLKSLLEVHGAVSQLAALPSDVTELQEEPLEYPLPLDGENNVRIIHLEKTNEHLGATVKNEGESVIIGRIVKGGVADTSGLLHEGDEILEVNRISMRGRHISDVSEMLANMTGTVTLMIIPGNPPHSGTGQRLNQVMHVRALFSYEPADDPYIPCRELGINFLTGDILHVIALNDPNWWQAFRAGKEEGQPLAGLIPSKSFSERRESMKNIIENKENKRKNRVCACGRKDRKIRGKKRYLYSSLSEDVHEIPTYEEITKYYPQPNRKRPVILLGLSNVGCSELLQRLLDSDPDRFGVPVPYTTHPPRATKLSHDNTFHHVSREVFNLMIQQKQFVEFGEHDKHLYGTSFDEVRNVVAQGKICLLKLQPETLNIIRVAELQPYIIFVCPPTLDKLHNLQEQLDTPLVNRVRKGKEVLTIYYINVFLILPIHSSVSGTMVAVIVKISFCRLSSAIYEDQMKNIIDCSREIKELYGHLFDFVLVNTDLSEAHAELLKEINRIEVEPQWVPAEWINN